MAIANFNEFQQFLNSQHLASEYGLSRLGVFGSLARGEKDIHDFDLLIEDENPDFYKLIKLKNYLEEILGMKVDLVVKKYADPIILYRAMKEIKYAVIH